MYLHPWIPSVYIIVTIKIFHHKKFLFFDKNIIIVHLFAFFSVKLIHSLGIIALFLNIIGHSLRFNNYLTIKFILK